MPFTRTLVVAAAMLAAGTTFAQSPTPADATAQVTQRQANQQQRVDNGLKNGSLTVKEAGRIERGEAALDRTIARDARNGITPREQAQINRRENALSGEIARDTHNAQKGNPASASSQRMQADVQRNANQDQRIANGVKSGRLTNKDVAGLERGQARIDGKEARAARNGTIGAGEQARVQRAENRQSRRIRSEKRAG